MAKIWPLLLNTAKFSPQVSEDSHFKGLYPPIISCVPFNKGVNPSRLPLSNNSSLYGSDMLSFGSLSENLIILHKIDILI
uniref:Uncharacterized protein n=1 Tax=Rhizophagus irregularis (strain DAOM 181602 / DAOM 197198 / MUCL 43194) TaxID=747089 RepID=U9UHE5_RHIID